MPIKLYGRNFPDAYFFGVPSKKGSRKLKPQTQFIFATHNANFPVLGDSEQTHACRYADETMHIESGSIDSPVIQQEIVDIMEGGEDAFNKRKEIYQIWKPQNS